MFPMLLELMQSLKTVWKQAGCSHRLVLFPSSFEASERGANTAQPVLETLLSRGCEGYLR